VTKADQSTDTVSSWSWILVSLRKHRALGARKLARELRTQAERVGIRLPENPETIMRTIRNWEHGRTHPDADYSAALVLVYATPRELFTGKITPGSELHRLDIAFQEMGVEVKRRQLLLTTLAATLSATGGIPLDSVRLDTQERLDWVLAHPNSLDATTIAELAGSIVDLRRRYESGPSVRLLGELSRQCDVADQLLVGSQSDAIRQGLCSVAGQTFTLAGWASWDLRDLVGVDEFYRKAGHASRELQDGWVGGYAAVSKSFIPMYESGALDDALDRLDQARDLVARGSSNTIGAWQASVEAEVHALNGDRRNCMRALERSAQHAARIRDDDPAYDLFNEARLGGFKGVCLMDLGDAEQADAELDHALKELRPDQPRQRAIIKTDRARARILQCHPEEGCRMLTEVLMTARSIKGYTLDRIFLVRRQLHPWEGERFVSELDEQIFALGYRIPR